MKLNLSSQIVLNKVPEKFYRPSTAVERSEITRCEKIPTDIFPKVEEGACNIADEIAKIISSHVNEGRKCVLGLGTGKSLVPVYDELISKYQKNELSFNNVVVFNAYEYFPQSAKSSHSAISQLHDMLLDHVDINPQNIYSLDGTTPQDKVQDQCRLYEENRSQDMASIFMCYGKGNNLTKHTSLCIMIKTQ